MATAIRTIGHEDRLSLVEHLEELRTRLIVSGVVLAVAFAVCLWQNHALLHVINRPYEREKQGQVAKGQGPTGQAALAQQAVVKVAGEVQAIVRVLAAPGSHLPAAARAQLGAELAGLRAATAKLPPQPPPEKLTTLGVGEPFTTTLTVVFFFALIVSLPVILYELYGFVMPALHPNERRAVAPLLAAVPVLFVAGVLFGYFVVLPAALRFLVNFNSSQFNIIVQAGPYYQFAATVLLAMGMVFQVPVAILGATRAGIVTPAQLRKGRRYAIVACAAVAAFLPGDAITLILETVPLYVLYEASILVAAFVARRDAARAVAAPGSEEDPPPAPEGSPTEGGPGAPGGGWSPTPDGPRPASTTTETTTDPSLDAIIDHMDRELTD
ncbi:MAG TPA: twin-arginine translocase subunit TatC [Solirubrobacteraceae bacterium]|jgi:sec-independent protein translocase protein TatC|nr:twin-arginine translocase subunit TatC [Solirubrobacteraceae bacterium]